MLFCFQNSFWRWGWLLLESKVGATATLQIFSIFIRLYVYGCSVCVPVSSVTHVTEEIPWNWGDRRSWAPMWGAGNHTQAFWKKSQWSVLLIAERFHQPQGILHVVYKNECLFYGFMYGHMLHMWDQKTICRVSLSFYLLAARAFSCWPAHM